MTPLGAHEEAWLRLPEVGAVAGNAGSARVAISRNEVS